MLFVAFIIQIVTLNMIAQKFKTGVGGVPDRFGNFPCSPPPPVG